MTISSPSGRSVPLVIDHGDYGRAVLLQGQPVPWREVPALAGYLRQVQALLDPDVAYVDVEAMMLGGLAARPELCAAMAERTRTGYALRTLLADETELDLVRVTVTTVGDVLRRRVALAVPSPVRFLASAHEVAGTARAEVSEDNADSASLYLAEWLGRLGGCPIEMVLLDARASAALAGVEVEVEERLETYTALTNVAAHLGWSIGLRTSTGIEFPPDSEIGQVVPDGFWDGEATTLDSAATVRLTHIPADAHPESVLERLPALG
ncbi:MAG TPA: hypothetical protein PLX71_08475 [Phycicoccus sp.]|nr:hypothetical protein [Phycicoccus sp.]